LRVAFHFRAAEIYRALRRKGTTIRSTIDCLIAVLAEEHGCAVLSGDRDMAILCRSGLLTTSLWPSTAA
jgi:predicted nucleic acid-binding protein